MKVRAVLAVRLGVPLVVAPGRRARAGTTAIGTQRPAFVPDTRLRGRLARKRAGDDREGGRDAETQSRRETMELTTLDRHGSPDASARRWRVRRGPAPLQRWCRRKSTGYRPRALEILRR